MPGAMTRFRLNITSWLVKGENSIVVAAYDPNDGRAPSGKNGPRGDYTFTSGIWQTVWLEPVSKTYIKNIRILPDLAGKRLKIEVNTNAAAGLSAIVFRW
jgi:beta-galactosidase/beta-glucuronidase